MLLIRNTLVGFLLLAGGAAAQTNAPRASEVEPGPGSIAGVVRDTSGKPVPGAKLSASGPKRATATADAQGHYDLPGLPAGRYRIFAFGSVAAFGVGKYKFVTLGPGQDLTAIDIRLQVAAEITGRVLDESGEPMPGVDVSLVGREYQHGAVRYTFRSRDTTNDLGEYRLQRVVPGTSNLVVARPNANNVLPAISEVPADPELRRAVPTQTYYPKSPSIDGAEWLTLRDGEVREGIDIRMLRSPSFCVEGILLGGGAPAALSFTIAELQPSFGYHSQGGMFGQAPRGTSGPDGRIRVCDLHPGEYRITARSDLNSHPMLFGIANVAITREDVKDITVTSPPVLPLSGEVVWDGSPPKDPVTTQVNLSMQPVYRAYFQGEASNTTASIPGDFLFEGLLLDVYTVRVGRLPEQVYVKDITYGGVSILHDALRLGTAVGEARLRIVLAHDSADLKVRVANEDGNPLPDQSVFAIPDGVTSEADLAAKLVSGQTDQFGVYSSGPLPPGTYAIMTADLPRDLSIESIGKLWRARPKAEIVEIEPGAEEEVAIEPVTVE